MYKLLNYHIRYARKMATYVYHNIGYNERLLPIQLEDVLKYRKDIIVKYGDLDQLDGFSAHKDGRYLIGINNVGYNPRHQRFTGFHETGHVFLKHHTDFKDLPDKVKEASANAFAGELLMPRHVMLLTAKYPIDYILDIYDVNAAAYKTRILSLKKWDQEFRNTLQSPAPHFYDFIKYTKLGAYFKEDII